MQTKLTLRLEESLIQRAKAHAERRGRSVSGLVADFFAQLEEATEVSESAMTPIVRTLFGALADADINEQDHRTHLERKHA